MPEIEKLMKAVKAGDQSSAEELLPHVYDELRKLAASYLAREPAGNSRHATSLVHDAYLRLVLHCRDEWNSEGHFFGAAAIAIRRILVEHARRKQTLKRGGDAVRHEFHDQMTVSFSDPAEDLLALDEALKKFSDVSPQAAELVQLVYFSGLTLRQAAEILEISPRTADRHWAYAKAWLGREIRGSQKISENW